MRKIQNILMFFDFYQQTMSWLQNRITICIRIIKRLTYKIQHLQWSIAIFLLIIFYTIIIRMKLDSIRLENRTLIDLLHLAQRLNHEDFLTGLLNRRGFDSQLESQMAKLNSSRNIDDSPASLYLMMIDIDHFKAINDQYGHLVGDKVLRSVGKIITDIIKERGFVARYGGEEFSVILHNSTQSVALSLAYEIKSAIERFELPIENKEQVIGNITVSLGVSHYLKTEALEYFVQRSDAALYTSKRMGRNRLTFYESELRQITIHGKIN